MKDGKKAELTADQLVEPMAGQMADQWGDRTAGRSVE
jgi:hypothetical protein